MTAADKRYARRFAVLGAVFLAVLLGSLLLGRYALSPGQLLHMLWTKVTGGAADWPLRRDLGSVDGDPPGHRPQSGTVAARGYYAGAV